MAMNMIIAGFGGQGVLFTGKIVAYTAMIEEKNVTWLPSYGPEMRGGTANCSVCIDNEEIASPVIINPNILIAMNLPSFDKFVNTVEAGGTIIIDSALIASDCDRTDVNFYKIPATTLSAEHDLDGLSNVILLGFVLQKTNFTSFETLCKAMEKTVPAKKAHLLEPNIRALKLGFEYNA